MDPHALPPALRPHVRALLAEGERVGYDRGAADARREFYAHFGELAFAKTFADAHQPAPPPAPQPQPAAPPPPDPAADLPPGYPELVAAMLRARLEGDDEAFERLAELAKDPDGFQDLVGDIHGGEYDPGAARHFAQCFGEAAAVGFGDQWQVSPSPRARPGSYRIERNGQYAYGIAARKIMERQAARSGKGGAAAGGAGHPAAGAADGAGHEAAEQTPAAAFARRASRDPAKRKAAADRWGGAHKAPHDIKPEHVDELADHLAHMTKPELLECARVLGRSMHGRLKDGVIKALLDHVRQAGDEHRGREAVKDAVHKHVLANPGANVSDLHKSMPGAKDAIPALVKEGKVAKGADGTLHPGDGKPLVARGKPKAPPAPPPAPAPEPAEPPDDDFKPKGPPVPARPDLVPGRTPHVPENGREPSVEELATGIDPGHAGGRRRFDPFSPAPSGRLPEPHELPPPKPGEFMPASGRGSASPSPAEPAAEPTPPVDSGMDTPPGAPPDLADPHALAAAVHAAARDVPNVFGQPHAHAMPGARSHPAGIADLYDHMAAAGTLPPGTTLDAFKASLLRAHLAGSLALSRTDLVQHVRDHAQLDRGRIDHLGSDFHAVKAPGPDPAAAKRVGWEPKSPRPPEPPVNVPSTSESPGATANPPTPAPPPTPASTSEPDEPDHAAALHRLAGLASDPDGLRGAIHGKDFLPLHDAVVSAVRGEHGPAAKKAVEAAWDDWGSHRGDHLAKHRRVAEELAKAGYGGQAAPAPESGRETDANEPPAVPEASAAKPAGGSSPSEPPRRHWYGMHNRPPGPGAVPPGHAETKPHGAFRHGSIAYDRPLTDKEQADYELTPIRHDSEIPGVARSVAAGMGDYVHEYLKPENAELLDEQLNRAAVRKKMGHVDAEKVKAELRKQFANSDLAETHDPGPRPPAPEPKAKPASPPPPRSDAKAAEQQATSPPAPPRTLSPEAKGKAAAGRDKRNAGRKAVADANAAKVAGSLKDALHAHLTANPRTPLADLHAKFGGGAKYDRNDPTAHPVNAALKELRDEGKVDSHDGWGEPSFSAKTTPVATSTGSDTETDAERRMRLATESSARALGTAPAEPASVADRLRAAHADPAHWEHLTKAVGGPDRQALIDAVGEVHGPAAKEAVKKMPKPKIVEWAKANRPAGGTP